MKKKKKYNEEEHEQFTRIAMALIKKKYPFEPQRRAIASKMYAMYLKRKEYARQK